ncbi:MAG: response regulator [Deltaproteobacteria bacterium]|nr:response regulator [Deltaproteobacteria bacterium]
MDRGGGRPVGGLLVGEGRGPLRRRALLALTLPGMALSVVSSAQLWWGGARLEAAQGVLLTVAMGASAYFLLRSSYQRWVAHALVGTWMAVLTIASLLGGGLHEAVLAGFFLSLVVPVLLLGLEGLWWSLVAVLGGALALVAEVSGWMLSTAHAQPLTSPIGFFAWLTAAGVLLQVLWIFERGRVAQVEAIEASNTQYRLVLERAQEGVAVLAEGRWCYVNQRLAAMLGREAPELVGWEARTLVIPEDLSLWEAGAGEGVLIRFVHASSAEPRWLAVSRVAHQWDGAPGTLCFFVDQTEAIAAKAALERGQQELLQVQKMDSIGRLAGGVAHDFNNHLTTIIGFGEMARDGVSRSSPVREDLDQVLLAAGRASQLTRQLLAISRKQPAEVAPFDLNEAVVNMSRMLRRLIGENIRLELQLDPHGGMIDGDVGQIEQVLMNLVVNARDAMPAGGRITVRTGRTIVGLAHHTLAVEDEGEGIPPALLERIMEPFFTTKPEGKGTGMGLSVVYGIVQQHGGRLEVSSTLGVGSAFTVYLPATEGTEDRMTVEDPRRHLLPASGELVLLVEDDEELRGAAARVLTGHGYQVLEAGSAEEATRQLEARDGAVSLLFADVVLPGISGARLMEATQERWPQVRGLLTTGYSDDRVQGEVFGIPGVPLLVKPYTPSVLLREVGKALQNAATVGVVARDNRMSSGG